VADFIWPSIADGMMVIPPAFGSRLRHTPCSVDLACPLSMRKSSNLRARGC
jgi:hypothetical protein